MVTKAHHMPQGPLPGIKDLYTLLDVLRNSEQYAAQVAELEGRRKELNDLIELVGPAQEIAHLHSVASDKLAEAQATLERAKFAALSVKAEAEQALQDAKNFRQDAEEALNMDRANFERELKELRSLQRQKEQELNARQAELEAAEARNAGLLRQAQEMRAEYEGKLERIKKVSAELQ